MRYLKIIKDTVIRYSLQALELLRKTFIEKGLTKPIFMAFPDNKKSIRIIESFGGRLIEEASDEQTWNTYEVNLFENNQNKNRRNY